MYVYVGNNPVNYIDPTGHMATDALGYLVGYRDTISELSSKYGLAPGLLASVVWNENKYRWAFHQAKDIAGLALNGQASLGATQVQMATAAFLDTNPDAEALKGLTHEELEAKKQAALRALSGEQKGALVTKLMDPEANLEYAAKYLHFVTTASGIDASTSEGAQKVLSNYNRGPDLWYEAPSAYGMGYLEFLDPNRVEVYLKYELLLRLFF